MPCIWESPEPINPIGYHMRDVRIVDDCGDRITGFRPDVFRELTAGHYVTLGRSDLSRLLFEKVFRAMHEPAESKIVRYLSRR